MYPGMELQACHKFTETPSDMFNKLRPHEPQIDPNPAERLSESLTFVYLPLLKKKTKVSVSLNSKCCD